MAYAGTPSLAVAAFYNGQRSFYAPFWTSLKQIALP